MILHSSLGRIAAACALVCAMIAPGAHAATAPATNQKSTAATATQKSKSTASVRAAAIRSIAILEDQRKLEGGELVGFLKNSDAVVRARAALAVGRIQDSTTVAALQPLLADRDAAVREEAVFALGQIGHKSARAGLERLLSTPANGARADTSAAGDPGDELRQLSIEALGKLQGSAATAAIVPFLSHRSAALRGEAAVALWRLADSTALDALTAHHEDPDPDVRWRVLWALEKLVVPDRVVLVAALHAEDPNFRVRTYAARTLGRQKSPRGTAYLLQMLDDREPQVVVNALRAIQMVADSASAPMLADLVQALGHADPYVRVTAATALADRFAWVAADEPTRQAAIDSVAARLADPDAATRGAAARALIARVGPDAWTAVRPLLDDVSIYTRVAVINAVTLLPRDRAMPVLTERLAPTTRLFERTSALDALGTLKARDALSAIRAALADTATLVVASAAGALAEIGDSASIGTLAATYAERVRDADADARISIRDALRQLAGRAYADSIERAHPAPAAPTEYPKDFADPSPVRGAVLHTTRGEIEWSFYRNEATQTVKNFVRLAQRGYFDGLAVHRVVPNFVIQDGDPTGTGSGGPGYSIRCEYNRLHYEPGRVGMALSGKDTGGSQWFITHSPQLHLDGRYTIFGRVTRGMDVVNRIVQGDQIEKVELLR